MNNLTNLQPQLASTVDNEIWFQKGGNNKHSVTNVKFDLPLNKNWMINTNQKISESSPFLAEPVADKQNLYILNLSGYLFKIDKKKGKIIWKEKIFNNNDEAVLGAGSIIIDIEKEIFT